MQEAAATKNDAIGAAILAAMAQGLTLPQAFDAVLGEGAYLALAGELYDALRAQAAS
jgi:hypothetical protein